MTTVTTVDFSRIAAAADNLKRRAARAGLSDRDVKKILTVSRRAIEHHGATAARAIGIGKRLIRSLCPEQDGTGLNGDAA